MLTKVRLVKAMVFPVVTYGCKSWTTKEAERYRIDVFEPNRIYRIGNRCEMDNEQGLVLPYAL